MRIAVPLLMLVSACTEADPPPGEANRLADAATLDNAAEGQASAGRPPPPAAEDPERGPGAIEPAPIPARFHGAWAEDEAACADPAHPSRLTVSGRSLRFPDFSMIAEQVATPTPDQFALAGYFEGTRRPAEAQYFLGQSGAVLTDGGGGGAVRVRCR